MLTPELDPIIYSPALQSDSTQCCVIETVEHIRTHCGGALGFFPMAGITGAVARDRILAAAVETEICVGFVIWSKVRKTLKIMAIGVEEDFRRYGIGTRLIEAVIRKHAKDKPEEIVLRCREDLEANEFWTCEQLAMEQSGLVKDNNKEGVNLRLYRKTFPKPLPKKDLANANDPDTVP